MGDGRTGSEGYERRLAYERRFEKVAIAYVVFSVAIALLGPILDPAGESSWRFTSQTIDALAGNGGNRLELSRYFTLMLVAFPVVLILLVRAYPPRAMPVRRPAASTLRMLSSYAIVWPALVFLVYLAFFLSSEITTSGRRTRGLMYFAANFDLGLGVVFGVIFVLAAMLAWLHIALVVMPWNTSGKLAK